MGDHCAAVRLPFPLFLIGADPLRVDVGSRLAKPSRSDARKGDLMGVDRLVRWDKLVSEPPAVST